MSAFAEFFAGIGLVRLALEPLGYRCVFANDIGIDLENRDVPPSGSNIQATLSGHAVDYPTRKSSPCPVFLLKVGPAQIRVLARDHHSRRVGEQLPRLYLALR